MSAAAAALLIALRLVLPVCDPGPEPNVRAERSIQCPHCDHLTWVTQMTGWEYIDTAPSFVDRCGQTHWHDLSRRGGFFHCCECCYEWKEERSLGGDCWCGFSPEDNEPARDTCPDAGG